MKKKKNKQKNNNLKKNYNKYNKKRESGFN